MRSAPQTALCCLRPRDQNSSSTDTTAKTNPGVPQPAFMSPQGKPHFLYPQSIQLCSTPPSSPITNNLMGLITLMKQMEVFV